MELLANPGAVERPRKTSSGHKKNGVIGLLCSVLQAGRNILRLQVGVILQDPFRRGPCRQELEDVLDSNPQPTDARAPSALRRVYGDPARLMEIFS